MTTTEQTTTTAVPTGTWVADTVHSGVSFEVPYAVATFTGTVPDFEATLADGKLTGVARIASITVKDENLEAHLLSPEFFDAERHPEVRFETRRASARRRRGRGRGPDHDQGHHEAGHADGHDRRPDASTTSARPASG